VKKAVLASLGVFVLLVALGSVLPEPQEGRGDNRVSQRAQNAASDQDASSAQAPATKPDADADVSAEEFGELWPFTVASGTLRCERESQRSQRLFVTLDTGNGIYWGLNGSARSFGYPDGFEILKPGKVGSDLQPFISRGLALCEGR